jgi:hypothetical protein
MRPLLALQSFVPAMHGPVMDRFGVSGLFRRAAQERGTSQVCP